MGSTKFNIIIPHDNDNPNGSIRSNEQILKNLSRITPDDINTLGEAINRAKEIRKQKKDIDNTKRCSEEHTCFIREYILRLGFNLMKRDPIGFVGGKPVFLGEALRKTTIFFDYDIIGKSLDEIYTLRDDENGEDKYVFSYDGVPVLFVRKDDKNIIIYRDQEIDVNNKILTTISDVINEIIAYKIKGKIEEGENDG